jgi:hypothetical protein
MVATILEDFTVGHWLILGLLVLTAAVFFVAALAPRREK